MTSWNVFRAIGYYRVHGLLKVQRAFVNSFRFRRLLQPRGDIGDKLPLSIKCPSRRASQIASDNQSPTPSLLVWLKNKPGGTASTDRRRGEGE